MIVVAGAALFAAGVVLAAIGVTPPDLTNGRRAERVGHATWYFATASAVSLLGGRGLVPLALAYAFFAGIALASWRWYRKAPQGR